jgi:hypothetical protein
MKDSLAKFIKYAKITLIHLLILAAAGGVIYGKTVSYRHEMEKQIWAEKQKTLEQEIEKLKAAKGGPQIETPLTKETLGKN